MLDKGAHIAPNLPFLDRPTISTEDFDTRSVSANAPEALGDETFGDAETNWLRLGARQENEALDREMDWECTSGIGQLPGLSYEEQTVDGIPTFPDATAMVSPNLPQHPVVPSPSKDTEDDSGTFLGYAAKDSELEDEDIEYDTKAGRDYSANLRMAPSLESAEVALADIKLMLQPHAGHKRPNLPPTLCQRLGWIKIFLWTFIDLSQKAEGQGSTQKPQWIAASLKAAGIAMKGTYFARRLRLWSKAYILDRDDLPVDLRGNSKISMIKHEDLASDLHLHLQTVGKYVKAGDIMQYLLDKGVQRRFGLKKTVSLATAKRWMHELGYRWQRNHRGQYVDGHERPDVVSYRQDVFIPAWTELEPRMRMWLKDGITEVPLQPGVRPVTVWRHDESTFYANDRRQSGWVKKGAGAKPQPKGEGESIMISDFVSPEHGWCKSPDGKECARVVFRAGKGRDGYFSAENIIAQTGKAMDLLEKYYPDSDHTFVFDNAPTHLKRAEDACSARHMPKGVQEWGVDMTVIADTGKAVYGPNGKVLKKKVRMADGYFSDGTPQLFYFPDDHEHAGKFKGMAHILKERGFKDAQKLRAQCKDFKCKEGETQCCCRRILFNQPDFINIPSMLEAHCKSRGFGCIILPKFHCELNFIEQCWGYAKRLYRLYPPTSKSVDMEKNVEMALDSIPIESMRR